MKNYKNHKETLHVLGLLNNRHKRTIAPKRDGVFVVVLKVIGILIAIPFIAFAAPIVLAIIASAF